MSYAERLMTAFEGSTVAHGTTTVGRVGRNGKAEADSRIVREPLTVEKIQAHIDGVQGVGAIPINEDNMCKFGAIDIDTYDLDQKSLTRKIHKLKLPLVHCRSKSGGAHLYLFLKEYEQASVIREYLTEMSIALGFSGCEIFPKQDSILAERGDVGNFINMPYFKAEETMRYGFNAKGDALELDKFLTLIESERVALNQLESMQLGGPRKYFTDGPPCLQHITSQGQISEERNKTLFMCGVYCRMKNPDDWVSKFEDINRTLCADPLPAAEVTTLVKSLSKKEYFYTCEQEPFKSYCDKEICKTKKYGVGGDQPDMPQMGGLTTLLSEPRLYFMDVGGKRVQLSTEQLQNQTLWQRACMEQINIMPPTVKAQTWQATVSNLMLGATYLEVPEELTMVGQFKEHLRAYCTSRIKAMVPEELEMGKPWTEDGLTRFTISGLMLYLHNRHFTFYNRAQVQEALKSLNNGAEAHGHQNINREDGKRSTLRVWWVPAFEEEDVDLNITEVSDDIPF